MLINGALLYSVTNTFNVFLLRLSTFQLKKKKNMTFLSLTPGGAA